MRSLLSLGLLAAASFIPSAFAAPVAHSNGPVIVHPGPVSAMRVTKETTLNTTNIRTHAPFSPDVLANFPISVENKFGGGGQLYAYITGLDPNGKVVLLQPNNQWYYPTSTSSSVPQPITANINLPVAGEGGTSTWTLPTYLSSGRVYVSQGKLTFSTLETSNGVALVQPDPQNPSDPSADLDWSFAELTNTAGGLYADISFVDFVGLPLGITMTTSNGQTTTVPGVKSNAVSTMCTDLKNYASSDGTSWDQLCQYLSNGTPLRVIAPGDYIAVHGGAFSDYYTNYVNQVWSHYSTTPLTINSQGSEGEFQCTVSGNNMNCAGGNRPFTKPSAGDIFGCAGTFANSGDDNAVVLAATPRICAALNRSTLLLSGGNVQPSLGASSYYTVSPTNRYSEVVHQQEVGGQGYAFPYDDVTPNGAPNASGTVASNQATKLTIIVGGAS